MAVRLCAGLILVGILGLAMGCSAGNAPVLVTVAPTSPTATRPVTAGSAALMLPQALKDVKDTQVFHFRVDPAQTSVEYAVHEVLLGTDQVTRGKTNDVQGEFQLYMQNGKAFIALSTLQVDLRTLTSDSTVRDQAIRVQWLESNKYPKAIFVANAVEGLPADAVQGQPYTFKVSGDMTIRNITRPVTFEVTATVAQDRISGEGTTQISMRDFGFEPPNVIGKTIVSDPVTITVKGVAFLTDGS